MPTREIIEPITESLIDFAMTKGVQSVPGQKPPAYLANQYESIIHNLFSHHQGVVLYIERVIRYPSRFAWGPDTALGKRMREDYSQRLAEILKKLDECMSLLRDSFVLNGREDQVPTFVCEPVLCFAIAFASTLMDFTVEVAGGNIEAAQARALQLQNLLDQDEINAASWKSHITRMQGLVAKEPGLAPLLDQCIIFAYWLGA